MLLNMLNWFIRIYSQTSRKGIVSNSPLCHFADGRGLNPDFADGRESNAD